ncbi:MAG: site-specific integrase [Marinifilaceae bacterium]
MNTLTPPKVSFFLRQSRGKSKELGALYLRIYYDGLNAEISLKRQVPIKKWNPTLGRLSGSGELARESNNFLDTIQARVLNQYRQLLDNNKKISAPILKSLLQGKRKTEIKLMELMDFYISQMEEYGGIKYAERTIQKYNTTKNHLQTYLKLDYQISDISISNIDHDFISLFERFLRTERPCNNNSAMKYLKCMKKVFKSARQRKWMKHDPFENIEIKIIPEKRYFLSKPELQAIEEKAFSDPRLQIAADMFLFACYTGLSYIDLRNLKSENIFVGIDGYRWISINRKKTDTSSNVPLLPRALKIIEKYREVPNPFCSELLLPMPNYPLYSKNLKEIARICGIKRNLTSHIARHTFATTVTLANGISVEALSRMLGHKSFKTTQIYAKVVEERISEEMQILRQKFENESSPKLVPKYVKSQ